jgi:tRNA A37 threonylcarbamoyltransferase TsaD
MLIEVSERAMAHCSKKELLLGGGVCCNKRLQEMAKIMCKDRNAECFIPENQLLVDNAAMIAWLGIIEHKAGVQTNPEKIDISPFWRTDQVEVTWR